MPPKEARIGNYQEWSRVVGHRKGKKFPVAHSDADRFDTVIILENGLQVSPHNPNLQTRPVPPKPRRRR